MIFFDIDDTLYDQFIPFENTFRKKFSNLNLNTLELFNLSRKFSDEKFPLTETNKISVEELQIYRIKKLFKFKKFS